MYTFTNLNIQNNNIILDGDVRLLGNTRIKDCNLHVSGDIILGCNGSTFIENGNIVSKSLTVENDELYEYFSLKNGSIHILDGNLSLTSYTTKILGDIIIENGNLYCNNIYAFSIYVNGFAETSKVFTAKDFFVTDGMVFGDIFCEGDFYAEEFNFNNFNIFVNGNFECPVTKNMKVYNN